MSKYIRPKYNIGQRVRIINIDKFYPAYEIAKEFFNFIKKNGNKVNGGWVTTNNDIVVIKNYCLHPIRSNDCFIYYVKNEVNGEELLINEKGLSSLYASRKRGTGGNK